MSCISERGRGVASSAVAWWVGMGFNREGRGEKPSKDGG